MTHSSPRPICHMVRHKMESFYAISHGQWDLPVCDHLRVCGDRSVSAFSSHFHLQKVNDSEKLFNSMDDNRLWSRRRMSVRELEENFPLRNLVARFHKRRHNHWTGLHNKGDTIAKLLLNPKLPKLGKSEVSHTKIWLRELNAGVKQVFGETGSGS
ncbi:hypothetical protein ACTXT7_001180 [Hymenolepis weldensis]